MPENNLLLAFLTIVVNAATTWGVVSTKLAWLRRDVDLSHERIDRLEDRTHATATATHRS